MSKSSKDQDILQLDLYKLLEITSDCTEKEITKAYRRKALKVHPDKNKDNPKAAEEFHLLSDALKILTDAPAKAAYDKLFKGRKLNEERTRALSDKRKKMRMDLEARENRAAVDGSTGTGGRTWSPSFPTARDDGEAEARAQLEREVTRLRAEWSATLEAQQAELRRKLIAEREKTQRDQRVACGLAENPSASCSPKFKLKWKSAKDDATNGGYTRDFVLKILRQYGDVANLIISGTRKGSAVVEYQNRDDAISAHSDAERDQLGFPDNPLKLEWIEGRSPSPPRATTTGTVGEESGSCRWSSTPAQFSAPAPPSQLGKRTLESMEADILSRMFQASKSTTVSSSDNS